MARPRLDRTPKLTTIYAELRSGQSRRAACAAAGIASKTLYEWMKDDASILERCEIAEGVAERDVVRALIEAAKGGEYAPAMYWLRVRRSKDWNEKAQQLNVNITGDVKHTLAFDPLIAIESRVQDVSDLVVASATSGNGNGNGHSADILIG